MKKFKAVNKNLFRSSAPTDKDIRRLSDFGINNIVSLDQNSADDIKGVCQELGNRHTIIPIDLLSEESTLEALKDINLEDLFQGNTLVHCRQGKDRTGLLIALFRTMMEGWNCKKAIKEAKEEGLGTGISFPMQEFFLHLIHSSCQDENCSSNHQEDHNEAMTAVQQSHDSQFTDNAYYGIAPYMDYDAENRPYGHTSDVSTTYQNRADYQISGITDEMNVPETVYLPQVGTYNSQSAYTNLFGPAVLPGGLE